MSLLIELEFHLRKEKLWKQCDDIPFMFESKVKATRMNPQWKVE